MVIVTVPNLKAVISTFQTLFIPHKPNLSVLPIHSHVPSIPFV